MNMEIEIAAYGWQSREWDRFYPEDMPADWRLDYYANEFFAVVVPYSEWSVQADDELLAWQQQVSEDFRFYWEQPCGEDVAAARLQALMADAEFAAHWGGVVDIAAVSPLPQPPFGGESLAVLRQQKNSELRPLREELEQAMAQEGSRLLVVVEAAAAETLRPARDLALLLGGG
ncbi:MAG: hypothetical protein ABFS08_08585 [Pseudomonadota bacterium]